MSTHGEDGTTVTVERGALVELVLKTLAVLAFYCGPVLLVYSMQGLLTEWFGPPSPTRWPYVVLVCLLVIWLLPGGVVLLPRLKRPIEDYVDSKYPGMERMDGSEEE